MRLRILSAVIVVLIASLAYVAWKRSTGSAPGTGSPAGAEAPAGSGEAVIPPAAGGMPPGMETTPQAADPGIAWAKPARWVEELASGMRLATYVIPSEPGGQTATCAVYYFGPGQGGGIDANTERWVGEFENHGSPVRRTRTVQGMNVTQIEVSGTYVAHAGMSGGSEAPAPGWTLLGAIVEGPNGALFFKLTGPNGTVAPAKKEFEGLLASMKKK